jgi:hypothetical protein
MEYEIIKSEDLDGKETSIIKRNNVDGSISWIPLDPTNADYQAYLNKDKPKVIAE